MASEDMRITEAANSDGRDLKFPRAMEKGDGKGGNGNSDVSRLFDMLTNIQHGQAALATKEDILGVKASQAEHDTQLAAMSERIADLEVKAQSSHAEAVAAANAEVQRAITVSIEQVKNDTARAKAELAALRSQTPSSRASNAGSNAGSSSSQGNDSNNCKIWIAGFPRAMMGT
eukprot:5738429-Pyramimonas_sp.AAC.1